MIKLKCKQYYECVEGVFEEDGIYPVMTHTHLGVTSTKEGNKFTIPLTPYRQGKDGHMVGGELDLESTGLSEFFEIME